MKKSKKTHFVKEINYASHEPWRTDFIFWQKGTKDHGHLTLSGATVIYLRDANSKEIIIDDCVASKKK